MKLIIEQIENVKYLTEEADGKKHLYIEGIFLQSEQKNRNGRVYPKSIMEREVKRYIKEFVETNRAWGELGHPDTPNINLDRASHRIVSLKEDGNNYIGRARILSETPSGKIAKALIDDGGNLGVSSRGLGSLKMVEGVNVIQDDYHLSTAADIVADPSAHEAFVTGIMESRDWIFAGGVAIERAAEEAQLAIRKAKKKDLEKVQLEAFEKFMKTL